MLLPALVLALLAITPVPDTGDVLSFGQISGGHAVTFRDGASGFAYWCTDPQACTRRARQACATGYTARPISQISRSQSPDTLRRDSSARNFYENATAQRATLVVICEPDLATLPI